MTKLTTYITRGKITESIHEAKCLIKNYQNKTIFSTGHENDLIYPRSSIKILQAIPFILSKGDQKFNLSKSQIAISCASHYGETEHIRVLENWLKKIKLSKNVLRCGVHSPLNLKFSNKLLYNQKKPNQLHNNCAGKHLGMITGCIANNFNIKNYLNINHPYQILIRKILEDFTDCKIKKKQYGIDGCSAPQYSFPIKNLSMAMINLIKSYNNDNFYSEEIKLLINSIKKYPNLIGSEKKYDSQLIKITKGKIFAKWGAEGVLLFAHLEKKIGGVIKIKDGNSRALPSAANEIIKKLSLVNKKELKKLSNWSNEIISNHSGVEVGKIFTRIK